MITGIVRRSKFERVLQVEEFLNIQLSITRAMSEDTKTYTICHGDGLYADDELENEMFAPTAGQNYKVNYFQAKLLPTLAEDPKSWSSIPEEVRNRINGITLLRLSFTAEDVELFPNLKV